MSELSRRRVLRVVATYAIGAFGALQSADVIVSALGLPHGLMTGLVVLTFVGLPVTAALAWVFDLTPQGVVRTPALAPAGSDESIRTTNIGSQNIGTPKIGVQTIAPPKRSRIGLVVGILAVALGLFGAGLWWHNRHKTPLPHDVVAVLPFTVRGSDQYKYLREGVAELLSSGISGGGALRAIDEQAVVRAIKESGSELDDETGRGFARSFGAGLFVIGSVLEVKDRLRLHARLFDASDGLKPIADANAEGDAGSLFALVDDLLRQLRPALLANGHAAANEPIVALAESTTTSLSALKSFIEGEQALREGDNQTALRSLQEAVAADPGFALAQYRLAVVASWTQQIPLGRVALDRALQDRDKLPPRERALIEAFNAFWHGNARDAEARYRAILEKNPTDAESWYQLGEVLFHDGPMSGKPESEAKSAFERAVQLDPEQHMYAYHLDDIARMSGEKAGTRRFDEKKIVHALGDNAAALSWLKAWEAGDEAKAKEIALATTDPQAIFAIALVTAEHNPTYEGLVEAIALMQRALSTPKLDGNLHAKITLQEAQLDCVLGKRAEGYKLFDLGRRELNDGSLDSLAAGLATTPFFPHPKEELTAALASLPAADHSQGSPPAASGDVSLRSSVDARREHDYLAARLQIALGDYPAAEKLAQSLQSSIDSDDSQLGADLALAVRAHLAAAQNRNADALALLEKMSGGVPVVSIGGSLTPSADRWLRGDLLHSAGRLDEALRWFDTIGTDNVVSCWAGPAHLQRAQILDQLGKKKEAIDQYRLFADLWQASDPDLRPAVENARARMGSLAGEHP